MFALQKHSGHVIVFLGNESPLGIPKQPIVFENARRLNALVVLVEHRYYGEASHPELKMFAQHCLGRRPCWQYACNLQSVIVELNVQGLYEATILHPPPARRTAHNSFLD